MREEEKQRRCTWLGMTFKAELNEASLLKRNNCQLNSILRVLIKQLEVAEQIYHPNMTMTTKTTQTTQKSL